MLFSRIFPIIMARRRFYRGRIMCKLVKMRIGKQNIKVAEMKSKYMKAIVSFAAECDCIDKIILFGSSITDACTEDSDIDIAVFGSQSKERCLTSRKFMKFADDLAAYDDFNQVYDILYFKTGSVNNDAILK